MLLLVYILDSASLPDPFRSAQMRWVSASMSASRPPSSQSSTSPTMAHL